MAEKRRGFGRVKALPSGRYRAGYMHAGRLHWAEKTFPTPVYADAWLGEERKKIDAGAWTPPAQRAEVRKAEKVASVRAAMTFREWAEVFMAERTDAGHEHPLRPSTAKDYRTQLKLRLLPAFGDVPVMEITEEMVTAWYRRTGVRKTAVPTIRDPEGNIIQRGGAPEGGPRARAKSYAALLAILNAAVADNRTDLTENPCKVSEGGRTGRTRDVDPLTVDELNQLVAAMPERLQVAVAFGGWLALRYGETFELRRRDVALEPGTGEPKAGIVRVRRGVTWTPGKVHIGPPKTRAGIRDVAIPPHLLPAVRRHLDQFTEPGKEALLFPNADGENLRPSAFQPPWWKARAAIGRDDLHYHDLRHVGLTMAAQVGATVRELMARAGHTKPDMAMRYQEIAHARDAQIAAALSKMAKGVK
mgnify:CR=1 FL=1